MDELPEEAPAKSWENENTVKSRFNDEGNNQKAQETEEADDDIDIKIAGQAAPKSPDEDDYQFDQSELGASEDMWPKTHDQLTSSQTDNADQRTYDQAEQSSEQANGRSFSQSERIYEPPDLQLSSLPEIKFSEQRDDRGSLEQTDYKLSRGTSRETLQKTEIVSEQDDHTTTIKTQSQVYEQSLKIAEDQADDQFGDDVSKLYTQIDYILARRQNEHKEDYRSYYKTFGQTDERYPELSDTRDDKEAEARLQPCKFEKSQTDLKSKLSPATETESETAGPAYGLAGSGFTMHAQGKDQAYEKLPTITTKVYYTSYPQEKGETSERSPDNLPASQYGKVKQSYKKKFPPIVYEDPYHVSLRYMEKHNILQIFQITEDLVYEKPEDPLSFMLFQVQEMIRKRDQK